MSIIKISPIRKELPVFHITSYLNNPNKKITDLNQLIYNPEQYFIDIDDSISIMKIYDELDYEYLHGAICIMYGDKCLMDYRLWDLIDQLWSYFINLIEDFYNTDFAETYFPDQPIKITISRSDKSNIIFTLNSSEWILNKHGFLSSILNGAQNFFIRMDAYAVSKNEYYINEINRIIRLKKILSM